MIWNIVNTTIDYILNMFFQEKTQNECPLYWVLELINYIKTRIFKNKRQLSFIFNIIDLQFSNTFCKQFLYIFKTKLEE